MRFLQLVLAFVLVLSMLAPLYGLNFGEEPKRTNFDYSSVFSTVLGHLRHVEGEDEFGHMTVSTDYPVCDMSDSESCDLSSMEAHTSTVVRPHGATRCIFSDSGDFAFQVIPGDSDKLVFYFQGGGACWSKVSTMPEPFCTTTASPSAASGIFDHSDSSNPYKDYTIVQVLYCSGDLHAGNVVRDYNDDQGQPVMQMGQTNTQSVIDWVKDQQTKGNLASTLTDLAIMGCSAGSIGAQVWGPEVARQIQATSVGVVPDSYAGIFPEGTQGPLIADYGMCPWLEGKVSDEVYQACVNREITLQMMVGDYLKSNPSLLYSYIQSKTDDVQMSFYITVGLLTPDADASITPEQFYQDVNEVFSAYNKNDNFITYLVDGSQHCYTPNSYFYSADLSGRKGKDGQQPTMVDWTSAFPLASSESQTTACYGDEETEGNWEGTDYCAAELVGKTYTQA